MSISYWINKVTHAHTYAIDYEIERVKAVAKKLEVTQFSSPVVTVTGTNGKGSCIAALEKIYLAAKYSTIAFTSPCFYKINEHIRINGCDIDDASLCSAFEVVEKARQEIPLTEFEFLTLAVLNIARDINPDVILLEVGMGGERDAVNSVDADIAIITNVHTDHMQWLGNDREKIAKEKSGIFRPEKYAIYGELDPPKAILENVKRNSVKFYQYGIDYCLRKNKTDWEWWSSTKQLRDLPLPLLEIQNMATALMAIELLQSRLPVTKEAISMGSSQAALIGRYQTVKNPILQIFDVAHNVHAGEWLAARLECDQWLYEKTFAVFSMLADKEIDKMIAVLKPFINQWYIAPLKTNRAASLNQLLINFEKNKVTDVSCFDSIPLAYQSVLEKARSNDRMVIFGSFHTVSEVNSDSIRKAFS